VIPGQRCNIGPDEIARRRSLAIALAMVTVVVGVGLVATHAPAVARLVMWPLATAATVTWLQVVRRFCVRFGALGLENFGRLGSEQRVDPRTRAADARRAAEMILEGIVVGVLVTAAFLWLPA
jgi:hypothetical protein